ncbi:hypothetical protein KUCAC02_012366 [Chaenocephalus aceratus]|uniref:Uncharacterized protein n=1 Tax=Chaenocephalus aceratus TaxID=36190 RepID=A0ACB9XB95_CHAAC|nr:hypothetical protein KUCAC02_012366 [Chaenocephalus aceratus]
MEEAWEWLESLGKGRSIVPACDKDSSKKTDKRNCTSLGVSLTVDDGNSGRRSRSKVRGQKSVKSDLDHQTSCCMGSQTRGKVSKQAEKTEVAKSNQVVSSKSATSEDKKNSLRETIIYQLSCLQDFQDQIARIDKQILELEEKQRAEKDEQEAQERMVEEEEVPAPVGTFEHSSRSSSSRQIKERRPTGPTELREWWTRWSQAQGPQPQTRKKVIHRSELTIYLGSTKV